MIQIHDDLIYAIEHVKSLAYLFVKVELMPYFDQGLERFKVIW